jgi:UDP-galactose transporter B1
MTSALQTRPVKLLISIGGIYISYIYFGLIMERLFNHNYTGETNKKGNYEKFNFGFATSIFQNLFSFIVAYCVNKFQYGDTKSKMDFKSEITIGFCSFGSVFLAAQALAHISFPVQALMKSSKIISILIVSFLLRLSSNHTKQQYFCGFIITLGIIIFNLTNEKKKGSDKETSALGLVMILGSLFCDGYLGTRQTEIKKKFNPSQWDQMQSLNKWAGLICLGASILLGQVFGLIEFITKYPAVITDLALLAVLGTFGQIFIFYTIYNFTPLFLSIVTTTRKFFTVLASIIIYRHPINLYQGVAIILVFIGVSIEMFSDKKHPPKEKADPIEYKEVPMKDLQDLEK